MPPPGGLECGPRGPQGGMMPNQRPQVNPAGPHPGLPHNHPMHPAMRFPPHPGMPGGPPMHRMPPQRWPPVMGGPPQSQAGGPPCTSAGNPPQPMLHSQPHPGIVPSPGHPGTPGGHGPPPAQSPSAHNDAHFPSQTPPTSDSINGPMPSFPGNRPSPHPPMDFVDPHMMNGGGGRIMPPPEYAGGPMQEASLKQSPSMQGAGIPHEMNPDFPPSSQPNGRGSSEFVPNGPPPSDQYMGPMNGASNGPGPVHFPVSWPHFNCVASRVTLGLFVCLYVRLAETVLCSI
ncbi:hypothetical protein Ciccas_010381 [Cichlidogyrus casuarinus]|uniref:Single stranded DNA binding protein 4 n=1 Tax=Cichlidogyrus casuarinus TaxID=1844966 RepID=A0ABD2PVG0_9PLAT